MLQGEALVLSGHCFHGVEAVALAAALEGDQVGEGTGLGLSTVYGLIRENKGSIDVKQTSENGTTFRMELPLLHSIESAEQES